MWGVGWQGDLDGQEAEQATGSLALLGRCLVERERHGQHKDCCRWERSGTTGVPAPTTTCLSQHHGAADSAEIQVCASSVQRTWEPCTAVRSRQILRDKEVSVLGKTHACRCRGTASRHPGPG